MIIQISKLNFKGFSKYADFTDEELIGQFQNDDENAFLVLVNRYEEPLLDFAKSYLANREEAEDIVQETFVKVYNKKHFYKEIAKFSTWIYTITANLAKTELRKRKNRRQISITELGWENKDFEIPDNINNPEKSTEKNFQDGIIKDAIRELSTIYKEVIILRDLQELSYEEISNILVLPMGTVKSRVNRARVILQEKLFYLKVQHSN